MYIVDILINFNTNNFFKNITIKTKHKMGKTKN